MVSNEIIMYVSRSNYLRHSTENASGVRAGKSGGECNSGPEALIYLKVL